MAIVFILYLFAGYWAAGVVLFEGKIIIHSFGALFMQKLALGLIGGIVLIPIALIKRSAKK